MNRLRQRYGHASKRGLAVKPPPGTRVRLTGIFLKNTGQQRGGEGSKVWTVIADSESGFPGGSGLGADFVTVNEPHANPEMFSDIRSSRADGRFMRSINIHNLQIVGAKPKAEDYP